MELARKTVTLRRTGGSNSVVLPKSWLRELGVRERVDLVRTDDGIVVQAPRHEPPSMEDEPEFATFLSFLMKDALACPERLGDVGKLVRGDDALFDGVEIEDE